MAGINSVRSHNPVRSHVDISLTTPNEPKPECHANDHDDYDDDYLKLKIRPVDQSLRAPSESVYDDDFLIGNNTGMSYWRTVQAAMFCSALGTGTPKGIAPTPPPTETKETQVAGHAGAFRSENGYLLKAMNENEATILDSLQDSDMKQFCPQYLGRVERDSMPYIKMQDILLTMAEPHVMDVKLGLRTYLESEAKNPKRRLDLYEKAVKLQKSHPSIVLSDEDKKLGITKYTFMRYRDDNSTTSSMGFRIQGALMNGDSLTHRYVGCTAADSRTNFRRFFSGANRTQKLAILNRMQDLYNVASESEWFARHELIGSSILIVYDGKAPTTDQECSKCGVWMIDFGRTTVAPHPLSHKVEWTMGSHEDGYLFGLDHLIWIMKQELEADIALVPEHWEYRAEGVDSIVAGYIGDDESLKGKVLRLAKQSSIQRFKGTYAGHPACAYNEFVSKLGTPRLGEAIDPGKVIYVTPEFNQKVAEIMDAKRPQFRKDAASMDLETPFQLLMRDASCCPGLPSEATIAVELKLKWGYTPPPTAGTHWIKTVVSRFAMLQYYKASKGKTSEISGYCPIEMFSGDQKRIQKVLGQVLDTPQNNIRILKGSTMVAPMKQNENLSVPSCRPQVDATLTELALGDITPSTGLTELLSKALCQPISKDQPHTVLKAIQDMQRLEVDIETLYPQVEEWLAANSGTARPKVVDLHMVAEAKAPELPGTIYCQSVAQQKLRGETDQSLERLAAIHAEQAAMRKAEVEEVEAKMEKIEPFFEINKFLLSQSAKDCSLMVSLAPADSSATPEDSNVIQGSDGSLWHYALQVLDLDQKNAEDMKRWYHYDQDIVNIYLRDCLGQADPEACREPPKL